MVAQITFDATAIFFYVLSIISLLSVKTATRDSHIRKRMFLCIIIMAVLTMASDLAGAVCVGNPSLNTLHIICDATAYIISALVIAAVSTYQFKAVNLKPKAMNIICSVYTGIILISITVFIVMLSCGVPLIVDENGNNIQTNSFVMFLIAPIVIYSLNPVIVIFGEKKLTKKLIVGVYSLLVLAGIILQLNFPDIPFLRVGEFASVIYMYINLFYILVESKYKKELKIKEMNSRLVFSQIKPHFLFNALSCGTALCRTDPIKAEELFRNFAKYLRFDLDALESDEPIPFTKELKFIENYVAIEKIRFEGRCKVEYEIGTEDFTVPPIAIQAIVENAIRHGISETTGSGTIKISTWDDKKNNYILVSDNGSGFDVKGQMLRGDFSEGLKAIEDRITIMGGELIVLSKTDIGTAVKVQLPKKKKGEKTA